jgi:hypothetical protein
MPAPYVECALPFLNASRIVEKLRFLRRVGAQSTVDRFSKSGDAINLAFGHLLYYPDE